MYRYKVKYRYFNSVISLRPFKYEVRTGRGEFQKTDEARAMTSPLPFQAQIRALERAKSTGQFESPEEVLEANGLNFDVGTAEDAAAAAQGYLTEMS